MATHWPPTMNWYSTADLVGIAQAAVPAGQADAALDRLLEVPLLFTREMSDKVKMWTMRSSFFSFSRSR